MGISNEPIPVIEAFIADQGITFPVLWDNQGVYGQYNIPGGNLLTRAITLLTPKGSSALQIPNMTLA